MHDFCFTIPYGMLLIGGGLIGYMKKGSITSFAGGAGTGLSLILAGYLSLKAFEKKKNSYTAIVLQTVISAALTLVMGQRYLLTLKVMPAGLVAGISALMTCFTYTRSLLVAIKSHQNLNDGCATTVFSSFSVMYMIIPYVFLRLVCIS